MATNRTPIGRRPRARITPEAIAAWHACDYLALHRALHLHSWNHSPLPDEVICLGVSQDEPPDFLDAHQREDWRNAQVLQRGFLKVAGWPTNCRAAYEENLREAEEWAEYCQELINHPERGGQGTGCDPISRRRKLAEAKDRVAYRRQLLDELEKAKA